MTVKLIATNDTLTAHARSAIGEIEKKLDNPVAIVIVALDESGSYKLRTYSDTGKIKDFDMYSRAEAIIEQQRKALLG
jgi:hypothetical protein